MSILIAVVITNMIFRIKQQGIRLYNKNSKFYFIKYVSTYVYAYFTKNFIYRILRNLVL